MATDTIVIKNGWNYSNCDHIWNFLEPGFIDTTKNYNFTCIRYPSGGDTQRPGQFENRKTENEFHWMVESVIVGGGGEGGGRISLWELAKYKVMTLPPTHTIIIMPHPVGVVSSVKHNQSPESSNSPEMWKHLPTRHKFHHHVKIGVVLGREKCAFIRNPIVTPPPSLPEITLLNICYNKN